MDNNTLLSLCLLISNNSTLIGWVENKYTQIGKNIKLTIGDYRVLDLYETKKYIDIINTQYPSGLRYHNPIYEVMNEGNN